MTMKTIPLTQGKVALVDDADYEAVNAHKWRAVKGGRGVYASRSIRKPDGKWTTQSMHQFLMPGVARIDHRDGNGLNNQRYNIRPATWEQNGRGFQHKRLGTTSKFRGVSWQKQCRKWWAQLEVAGKKVHIGLFESEFDAALAYDAAARHYFGEYASPNFQVT